MSSTLVETDSFDSDIPGIDDGAEADETTFETPIQKLTNRTKYLRARIETDGVKKIYNVGTIAELKAITGAVVGQLCLVPAEGIFRAETSTTALNETISPWVVHSDDSSVKWVKIKSALREVTNVASLATVVPLHNYEMLHVRTGGIYRFTSASVRTVESPWIVDGVGGQWFRLGFDLHDLNGGASGDQRRLDPTKLAVPNRIVEIKSGSAAQSSITTSTSGVAFGATITTTDVKNGDSVIISGFIQYVIADGAMQLKLLFGTTVLESFAAIAGDMDQQLPISFTVRHAPGADASHAYTLKAYAGSGTPGLLFGNSHLTAMVVRP